MNTVRFIAQKIKNIFCLIGFKFIEGEDDYAINEKGEILSFKYKEPKLLKKYLYHSREYVFFNKKRKRVDILLKETFNTEHI